MKFFRIRRFLVLIALLASDPGIGEEFPVIRRSFASPTAPVPPFTNGVFDPQSGETISFLGGTDVFDLDRDPFFETMVHLAWPDRILHFRNLAWQGDSIYYQARPRFFYTQIGDPQPGSIPDHRERTSAGIICIGFGKMESLEAGNSLEKFTAAYTSILDDLSALTGRLVLFAPTPFYTIGPASDLAKERNERLETYVQAIESLAKKRGLLFVDLFHLLLRENDPACSSDGVHLSALGQNRAAQLIATELKFPKATVKDATAADSLREAIRRKNRLWQQYYRPTNWAFLFGDRQHVPASRDVENRDGRWFVREIDSLPGLIAETEADIHRYAGEASVK
ncbi:MAG: hypothetical protein KBF76_01060 [Verrucomicrobiales bacterium]|jgi:hypothetical protein|nr:hypothetical protein [Verrucomicrobiales bacterium]